MAHCLENQLVYLKVLQSDLRMENCWERQLVCHWADLRVDQLAGNLAVHSADLTDDCLA